MFYGQKKYAKFEVCVQTTGIVRCTYCPFAAKSKSTENKQHNMFPNMIIPRVNLVTKQPGQWELIWLFIPFTFEWFKPSVSTKLLSKRELFRYNFFSYYMPCRFLACYLSLRSQSFILILFCWFILKLTSITYLKKVVFLSKFIWF